MDGYTLDSLTDPDEEPPLVVSIDLELRRIGSGCLRFPSVRPHLSGDPRWLIRVGDDSGSVLCYAFRLLDMLKEVPTGTPTGHPDDVEGSVWAVLQKAAQHAAEPTT